MAATESDFLTNISSTIGGGDVKDQWPPLVRAVQSLTAYFNSKLVNGTEPNDNLTGFILGDSAAATQNDWRMETVALGTRWDLNTGTEGTPIWTPRVRVGATGAVFPGFFPGGAFTMATGAGVDQWAFGGSLIAQFVIADLALPIPFQTTPFVINPGAATNSLSIQSNSRVLFVGGVDIANGSVGTPSLAFSSDQDTGIYRIAANALGVAAQGALRLRVDNAGVDVTGDLSVTGFVTKDFERTWANRTTTFNYNNTTWTSVDWNVTQQDDGAWHNDSGPNPSRVTPGVAGWYYVEGHVRHTANTTGDRGIRILLNGTTLVKANGPVTSATANMQQEVNALVELTSTLDYIEIQAYQSSGAPRNLEGTTGGNNYIRVTRVG